MLILWCKFPASFSFPLWSPSFQSPPVSLSWYYFVTQLVIMQLVVDNLMWLLRYFSLSTRNLAQFAIAAWHKGLIWAQVLWHHKKSISSEQDHIYSNNFLCLIHILTNQYMTWGKNVLWDSCPIVCPQSGHEDYPLLFISIQRKWKITEFYFLRN